MLLAVKRCFITIGPAGFRAPSTAVASETRRVGLKSDLQGVGFGAAAMAGIALIVSLCLPVPSQAASGDVLAAVASNFSGTMERLVQRYQEQTGNTVSLAFSSTGKHYAQIRNGAPFDIFFAADARRPRLLEDDGLAVPGSRFTYAFGRLALWSADPELVDGEGKVLERGGFHRLAIANPRLAPYGEAARETLQSLGFWEALHGSLVYGENVNQTFHFIESGNAALGFVAHAQVIHRAERSGGSHWLVPEALYSPVEQQAVLLSDNAATRAFAAFIRSDEALAIIRRHGYGTP